MILIAPWVRNLALLADPAHDLFEESNESIRSAIRSLVEVTVHDTEVSTKGKPNRSYLGNYPALHSYPA